MGFGVLECCVMLAGSVVALCFMERRVTRPVDRLARWTSPRSLRVARYRGWQRFTPQQVEDWLARD